MRISVFKIAVGFAIIIASVLFMTIAGDYFQFSTGEISDYVYMVPAFLFVFTGGVVIASVDGPYKMGGYLFLGIGLAFLFETLNTASVFIPSVLTYFGFTLTDLQLGTVFILGTFGAWRASV